MRLRLFALLAALTLNLGLLCLLFFIDERREAFTGQFAVAESFVESPSLLAFNLTSSKSAPEEEKRIDLPKDPKPLIAIEGEGALLPKPQITAEPQELPQQTPRKRDKSARKETKKTPQKSSERTLSSPSLAGNAKGNEIKHNHKKGEQGREIAQSIERSIYHYLASCYPESSKRRGEEGVAELSITIAKGRLQQVNLLKSTQYRRLDQCAQTALKAAGEKALQEGVYSHFDGVIKVRPIRFQLR